MSHTSLFTERSDLITILFLSFCTIIFIFICEYSLPGYFLWDDNATQFLPYYLLDAETLFQDKTLAFINYYQYAGTPHLAVGQTGVLYPPIYVAYLFASLIGDLRHIITFLVGFHFVLGALFSYLLMRNRQTPPIFAFLLAIAWVTFSYNVQVSRSWVFHAYIVTYLPLNQWLLEKLLKQPKKGNIVAFSLVKTLLFFQGYVQYAFIVFISDIIFLSFTLPKLRGAFNHLKNYLLSIIGFILLSAPLWLPMLYQQRHSAERSTPLLIQDILENYLDPGVFLKAQGFSFEPLVIHLSSASIFYIGVPFILLLLPVISKKIYNDLVITEQASLWVSLIGFMLSTTAYGALVWLPPFGYFRWPFKHFILFLFHATLLAGSICRLCSAKKSYASVAKVFMVLALAGNLALASIGEELPTFGPHRMEKTVQEARKDAHKNISAHGRMLPIEVSFYTENALNYGFFDAPTLLRIFGLCGYDPLVLMKNFQVGFKLRYHDKVSIETIQNKHVLQHINLWGVNTLIAPYSPSTKEILDNIEGFKLKKISQNRLIYTNNHAHPLIELITSDHSIPLDFYIKGNTIYIPLPRHSRPAKAIIAFLPLPFYTVKIDGKEMAFSYSLSPLDKPEPFILKVPPNSSLITLTYVDRYFLYGLFGWLLFPFLIIFASNPLDNAKKTR